MILFLINIILLVVGTFMDMTPACLIFTPIFLPVCQALGMNTIHFGIMLIFNLCIGTITPPVGSIPPVQKMCSAFSPTPPPTAGVAC